MVTPAPKGEFESAAAEQHQHQPGPDRGRGCPAGQQVNRPAQPRRPPSLPRTLSARRTPRRARRTPRRARRTPRRIPPEAPDEPSAAPLAATPAPSRAEARFQLGVSSAHPAATATAATAPPAPAPTPRTQTGGAPARNSAESTRMMIRPGTMNARPPTRAPSRPHTRQAQKIASSVDAGPGSRLQVAIASSNSAASSQPSRSTHSRRKSAMWAGGPPNPVTPIRPHSRSTTPRPA